MANRSKHKKGEAGGFSWIIAIVVLVLSAGVILWVLQASAAKADEKTKVDLCRVSNEIKVGMEHRTKEIVSTPRFCSTIDKTSGKALVPTKNYPQNIDGAKTEIRDMAKNCWYMWLDGAEPNMFRLFPEEQSCRICYKFKLKDGLTDKDDKPAELHLIEIIENMQEPYFASDTSDKCNPPNGGYLRNDKNCAGTSPGGREQDPEKKEVFEKMVSGKFCCRRELTNECYNKGGNCLDAPSPQYGLPYTKWACPADKNCYVEGKNMVSYMEYIIEYQRVGEFSIEDPGGPVEGITYQKDKKYAVSFISPAKKCTTAGCKMYSFVEDQTGIGTSLKVIQFLGSIIPIPGVKKGTRSLIEATDFLSVYPPNKIMLSTYDIAKEKGCREE